MKSRSIVTAVVAAAMVLFASLSSAHAGLLGGGCGCEPKCCAPEPKCCKPEPKCCKETRCRKSLKNQQTS